MGSLRRALGLALCLVLLSILSSSASANLIGDASCKLVDCGQGVCNGSADDSPPFFFRCECYPGWSQFSLRGSVVLPSCVIPNCTLDFNGGSPSPPALPSNLSDPCALTWCGNGTCASADGGGHKCNCDYGAFNLINKTDMPCFQPRYLGSDCVGHGLGPPPPSSKLLPPPPPPPPSGTLRTPGPMPAGSGSGLGKVGGWIQAAGFLVFLMSLQLVI